MYLDGGWLCRPPRVIVRLQNENKPSTMLQKRFQAADVDDNGSLSRDEFSKSQAAKRAADPDKLFNSADTNGDGTLTFSELAQAIRKLQSNRQ